MVGGRERGRVTQCVFMNRSEGGREGAREGWRERKQKIYSKNTQKKGRNDVASKHRFDRMVLESVIFALGLLLRVLAFCTDFGLFSGNDLLPHPATASSSSYVLDKSFDTCL